MLSSSYRFTPNLKLNKTVDFQLAFRLGIRLKARHSFFIIRPNQLNYPRLGVVIGKKQIAKAVSRNKIKRLVREQFRLNQHKLGSHDVLLVAQQGFPKLSPEAIKQYLDEQWQRVFKRCSGVY